MDGTQATLAPWDVVQLGTGPHASAYGTLVDGREFSFQIRSGRAVVYIYRPDTEHAVPGPEDVELTVSRGIEQIDLDDERSVRALVLDMITTAHPKRWPG